MIVNPLANAFSVFWFVSGVVMLVPHFVFTFFLEKRKHFLIRTIIGILCFAIGAYFTCFTDQWNERYYLLLHLLGALYLAFCSKCSLKMIIYFNIWCIVLYYFIFQILSLANALMDLHNNLFLVYVNKCISLILLIVLEIVIIKSIFKKDVFNIPVNQVVISGLISVAIIAFNTITFAVSPDEGYTRYIFQIFSMLCNVLAMYMQVVATYSQKKNYESEYIKHMWKVSKRDHQLKSEYVDLINHKYHDLKHEIRALRQLDSNERNERLDQIERTVEQYGNLFDTDNELLDAILNDVRRHCDKENIMFSCVANCKNIDFMDIVDLSILLGNALDNAIEASVCLPEDNRVIDLKLLTDEHFFRITEKNKYQGTLDLTDDGIISSKEEKGYHGFGLQSIKYLVDKYKGQMALDAQDGVFSMHIIIPIPEK